MSKKIPEGHLCDIEIVFQEFLPNFGLPDRECAAEVAFIGEIAAGMTASVCRIREGLEVEMKEVATVIDAKIYSVGTRGGEEENVAGRNMSIVSMLG